MLHDRFSKATLEDIYHPKGNLSGSSQTLGIILTDSLQDGNFKMSCAENLSTFNIPKSPIHAEPIQFRMKFLFQSICLKENTHLLNQGVMIY